MKIAFTHNLRVSDREEEAEFDSPETVERLAEGLRNLGHEVHLVEVSGRASRLAARLEALRPDLVFNTAEGTRGRYREAFFPALFEQLDLPFTGSDAYTCAVTLDKQASKLLVQQRGVPTPRGYFWDGSSEWDLPELTYPVIVKPNFEGSSKGITSASVFESDAGLVEFARECVGRYPTGVLVEEFIGGRDVTVPFLAAASTPERGVLAAASYEFGESAGSQQRWAIYDYSLKNERSDEVRVLVPAEVGPDTSAALARHAREVVQTLGVRDLGRVDFRVTDDGKVYFIEVNALPSLEPGASIYESAAHSLGPFEGDVVESVLGLVLESAQHRCRHVERSSSVDSVTTVGLAYNLKRVDPASGSDVDAEFDSPSTIAALRTALETLGHEVVELEATPELLQTLSAEDVDVVFNIAEGLRGRNREAQLPAVLELLDIPYTGSDPATLAITLDKGLSKRLVREAGLPTPCFAVLRSPDEVDGVDLRFPVIAKPNAEGSSKGVSATSVCEGRASLREQVSRMATTYAQGVLVEEYLTGREFTLGVLGEHHPRVLPAMEIVFGEDAGPHPVYSFGHKIDTECGVQCEVPAKVDEELRGALERLALGAFVALGCRDVARIDVRLDGDGEPHFIECNPLPGLTPGWSDLCQIAAAAGMDYGSLVGEILSPALRRLEAKREAS